MRYPLILSNGLQRKCRVKHGKTVKEYFLFLSGTSIFVNINKNVMFVLNLNLKFFCFQTDTILLCVIKKVCYNKLYLFF